MNTETLNALKEVGNAKNKVLDKLTNSELGLDEKKVLGNILINLQEQEDILINYTLQDMVDKVSSSNSGLQDLIIKMNATSLRIESISNTIEKISKTLSILVEITAKALSVGLIP